MLVETTTFRLRPDADDAAFLDADRELQTALMANHAGFLRRTTARSADGKWLVVTLWEDEARAEASATKGFDDPVVSAFLAHVDETTFHRERYLSLD